MVLMVGMQFVVQSYTISVAQKMSSFYGRDYVTFFMYSQAQGFLCIRKMLRNTNLN